MVHRWLVVGLLAASTAAAASAEIGRIKTTLGAANVERSAAMLPASTGFALLPGDTLVTGKDGKMSLTFADNTRFAVGPDSRIALTKFDYDPTSEKGSFIAQVERGSIAVVSGRIAKGSRDGMQIKTPDSTVDVRGTRFIVVVKK
jgi:hypothetical protein